MLHQISVNCRKSGSTGKFEWVEFFVEASEHADHDAIICNWLDAYGYGTKPNFELCALKHRRIEKQLFDVTRDNHILLFSYNDAVLEHIVRRYNSSRKD